MTPLQKELKDKKPKLDIDSFGEIMDEFIEKNDCKMLIEFR